MQSKYDNRGHDMLIIDYRENINFLWISVVTNILIQIFGRTDAEAEAEAPIVSPPDVKR